jgi:hypothetical protein
MDIPTYIKSPSQENYHEELNQVLIKYLSNNGWTLPPLTNAQLTTAPFVAPDGTLTTIANFMPNGTQWYVSDTDQPGMIVKINGALRRVSTTSYP